MDRLLNGISALLQVFAIIAIGAIIVYVIKRLTALDAEMRERATRETRLEKIEGVGHIIITAKPIGLFRWQPVTHIEYNRAAPPVPVIHVGAFTQDAKPKSDIVHDDPRRRNAVEVLLQTRQHGDYGERSQQIITAFDFKGSPDTWQAGVNFLKEYFGITAIVGKGTYCGADHPTIMHLMRAVSSTPPLQTGGATNPAAK